MAHGSSKPPIDLIKIGGTAVSVNSGNKDNGTLRVTLATDQVVVPISDNAGSLTVDNAGTFAVQAAQSGTWNVGLSTGSNAIGSITNTSFAATQATASNLQMTATQALGSAATRWYTQLSDGTNSPSIKAASVAALTTDPALVVAVSPNNSVTVAQSTAANLLATVSIAASQTLATVTNLAQLGGTAIAMGTGVRSAGTQRVTIATDDIVPASQSGTWTVGLSTGSNAIGSITNTSFASTQSGTWTVQPGNTANTTPWLTKLSDGTNAVAIKAASTAAGATDPALVVAVSPNNSVTVSQATAANLNATVTGTVELGATSLAALENISVTVPGTVDLGTVSLTALETITVTQSTPANLQVSATQVVGSAATRWYTQLSDGTNSPSIKAASTAAAALDPSLVVALSPNSPLPAGTNGIGKLTSNTGVTIGAVEIAASQTLGTVSTLTNQSQMGGQTIAMGTGVRSAGTQRVTIATDDVVPASQSGTWNITNVSGTVSLPTGAATAAKQPALGTAGTASTDVITVQGISGGVALPVSGTFWQTTQPVSGTVALGAGVAAIGTVTLNAETTKVIGTVNIASSQSVVLAAGTAGIGKLTANSGIDIGDVDVTSIVPGTGATNLGKAVDGAAGGTDTGVMALAVRDDALATLTPVDGDYTQLRVTSQGRLWASATIDAALPAGSANIGTVEIGATSLAALETISISGVSGTVSLPTGAATETTLASALTSLQLLDNASAIPGSAHGNGILQVGGSDGTNATRVRTDTAGILKTSPKDIVANANNSTTTNLAISGVFTGTSTDVSGYSQVMVNVYSSHASAANGLSLQFSQDGTNWDSTNTYTVAATTDFSIIVPVTHTYFRLVYTNGATLTTTLRIATSLRTETGQGTIKKLNAAVNLTDPALSTRSVISGTTTGATPTAVTDATVKLGSAAAVAADTSLVVQLHPSGVLGTATVKTAITEPAFGTDTALVVQTRDPVRIRPSETYRDPVDKMRVSMGQSLIDTDFEYGIQPTKWESLTLLNNRGTAFYDVTQVAPGTVNGTAVTISAIAATAKVVTVTGTNINTVFSVGQPIFITGTLDTANVDGWWIVDTASATTLTFLVNTAPAATLYDAGKTYLYPATFFTGANIPLATSAATGSVTAVDATGTFTCASTAIVTGQPVVVTGTRGGTSTWTGYTTLNVYYILSATNAAATSFQLSALPGGVPVTTTAGTVTGLTFTKSAVAVSGTIVIVKTLNDHGLRIGNSVYMTGTTGVTGGPVNGTWIVATTPTNDTFTYTTNATATGAITSTPTTTLYPRQPGYIEHRPYDGGVQFSNETAYHGYTDIRQTRRYFRYQSGKGIQFSTGTIMKPPFYVDSLTASGSTVTVNTKYPHGLLVGSTLIVSGATPAAYNGTFTVTASTALTITYTAGSAPGTSPATGFPITVSPGTWYGGSNRVGMFDQQNGFFFEFDGQTLYAVIRKSTDQISGKVAVTLGSQTVTGTGSYFSSQLKPGDQVVIRGMAYIVQNIQSDTSITVYPEYRGVTSSNCICTKTVETRTAQSAWNIDTVNSGTRSATNPNGFTLDLTKMQMFYADYSWYGAGAVRFGFKDQRGEVIFVHRVVNSNVNYEAYMRSGNLPARYETNTLPEFTYLTATLAAATTTGGTISVADTTLFPSSGTIILTQASAIGAYSEYITYSAKTGTTFTITARAQAGGASAAQTFTYSATAPIKVELYAPQAAQTLSHWGSSVIMDGGYDDDKSLVFNTGQTTLINTPVAGTRYPLLSLRLSPTVDNGITGLLGEREIVNRMQLALRSMGIYTKNVAYRIEVLLNGRVSSGTFAAAGGSSLAQVCNHAGSGTVTTGESMFAFYSNSNDTISQDISQVRDLGTSILGGGTSLTYPSGNSEKFPDGPDIVTVVAIPLESTPSIAIASIADTAGNFTCTATTGLAKGQRLIITGTFSNGNITGHASGAQYYIIATNGRTTFQLSATEGGTAVASTAGTGAGVTVTNSGTGQIAARINWTEAQA